MNMHRDKEAVIATWLEEGPVSLPAESRHAIATAVRAIPQHRPGVSLPWRLPVMNGSFRLVAAAVTVLVATLGGAWLLGSQGQVPPGVGASPSPTLQTPTPRPSASMPPSLPLAGHVTLQPDGCTFQPAGVPLDGAVTFELVNATNTSSGFDWFRLNPGYTFEQFMEHMEREIDLIERGEPYTGPPPGASLITQAAVDPGTTRSQGVGFSSGTYVLVCIEGVSATENPIAYRIVGPLQAGTEPVSLGSVVLTGTACRAELDGSARAADQAVIDLRNGAAAKDGFFELYRIPASRTEDFAAYVEEEQRRAAAGESQAGYPEWPLGRWTRNVPGGTAATLGASPLDPGTYVAACGTWDDKAKRILGIWPVEPFTID